MADLGPNANGKAGSIEQRDRPDAARTCAQRFQKRIATNADRADNADAGDDNFAATQQDEMMKTCGEE